MVTTSIVQFLVEGFGYEWNESNFVIDFMRGENCGIYKEQMVFNMRDVLMYLKGLKHG